MTDTPAATAAKPTLIDTIEQDVEKAEAAAAAFFGRIEKGAVVAWEDFLKGITFLAKEAALIAAALEKADPAIITQVQEFILAAEQEAAQLANNSKTGMTNVIADAIDAAEQVAATTIQAATGNSQLGVAANALLTTGIADLGSAVKSIASIGFARAIAGLLSATSSVTALDGKTAS